MLTMIVEDTGIGIAAEHLPHLFDRFYRTDEARSRERGGSGLGLAIAKQYIVSHQGTVKVESLENQGTRFTIQLPYV
ncbi:Sensor kinase CusS [compost metagenome]